LIACGDDSVAPRRTRCDNVNVNEKSGRQRLHELRSVSGRIARDRSHSAQRSSQGSKTAAGRKRSPRERADLDGENNVVAWVDTASPPNASHRLTRGVRRQHRPDSSAWIRSSTPRNAATPALPRCSRRWKRSSGSSKARPTTWFNCVDRHRLNQTPVRGPMRSQAGKPAFNATIHRPGSADTCSCRRSRTRSSRPASDAASPCSARTRKTTGRHPMAWSLPSRARTAGT
jgi:hypothetical protein